MKMRLCAGKNRERQDGSKEQAMQAEPLNSRGRSSDGSSRILACLFKKVCDDVTRRV